MYPLYSAYGIPIVMVNCVFQLIVEAIIVVNVENLDKSFVALKISCLGEKHELSLASKLIARGDKDRSCDVPEPNFWCLIRTAAGTVENACEYSPITIKLGMDSTSSWRSSRSR